MSNPIPPRRIINLNGTQGSELLKEQHAILDATNTLIDPDAAPESWSTWLECEDDDAAVRAMAQAAVVHAAPWVALFRETPAARLHGTGSYRIAHWNTRSEGRPTRDPKPWYATFGARKPAEVAT